MDVICSGLSKTYPDGTQALKDVTLNIHEGLFGLLGPNGAGKTTLMEIMTLLLEPTSGKLIIGGYNSKKSHIKIREMLGYLPQFFGYYPELTAKEFLHYLGIMRGMDGSTLKKDVDRVLSLVRLHNVRNKRLKTFSGGMLRRVGIAQAILSNPKLIIVDEPTAGLDPEERVNFRNLLFELGQDRVIILSTHIVKDIEETCTQVALLYGGRIRFHGSPASFVQAAQGETWEFYGNQTDLDQYSSNPNLVSVREGSKGICFRIVSSNPPQHNAMNVVPNLEDAYVRFLGKEKEAA